MRTAMKVLTGLCFLVGGIWFLQGINVLPGSFMTGNPRWAVYGGLLWGIGAVLLIRGRRRQQ